MTGKQEAEELLFIEEADAWFEYLEATRGQTATRYREVEPWAWARLTQRMRAIKAPPGEAPARGRVGRGPRHRRLAPSTRVVREPPDGGLAERARARIRNGALYSPPRYRNEVEQLPRERRGSRARRRRSRAARGIRSRALGLEPVGLLEPQDHPDLVQGEHGQVGAGDEHDRRDDRRCGARTSATIRRRPGRVAPAPATASGAASLAEPPRDRACDRLDREALARPDPHDVGREHERNRERRPDAGPATTATIGTRARRARFSACSSSSSVGSRPST